MLCYVTWRCSESRLHILRLMIWQQNWHPYFSNKGKLFCLGLLSWCRQQLLLNMCRLDYYFMWNIIFCCTHGHIMDLMMFLPLYYLVMNWLFLLKLSYRIESLRIWEHLMYVLSCLSLVTMGYHVIRLDVCFGDQFAGSVMNLCIGVGTCFRLDSPVETLGHSLKYFVSVE